MPPSRKDKERRDLLISRLQEHAGLGAEDLEQFQWMVTAVYYFSLPDNMGGALIPGQRYYRRNGKEVTFQDVPLAKILKELESFMKSKVKEADRERVRRQVLVGMPGYDDIQVEESTPNVDIGAIQSTSISNAQPATSPISVPDPIIPMTGQLTLDQKHLSLLLARLQIYAGFRPYDLRLFVSMIITSNPGAQNIEDVPYSKVAEHVEAHIAKRGEDRTEVYHKIFAGLPCHKKVPVWEQNCPNPNGQPSTQFSTPRDGRTNKDMLDAFARAARFTAKRAKKLGDDITLKDAAAGGTSAQLYRGVVKDGRLGRDHTIDDVPVNYFRDTLMYFIFDDLDANKRDIARKSICPDLTEDEIRHYALLLLERRQDDSKNAVKPKGMQSLPTSTPATNPPGAAQSRATPAETEMEKALQGVNDRVDVDDRLLLITVMVPKNRRRIDRSVVKPGALMDDAEARLPREEGVNMEPDQVRAMIKIFVNTGEWTLEQFRQALGNVSCKQLTDFLKATGTPQAQSKSPAFLLSWEFFQRREEMDLPLRGARVQDDVELFGKWRAEGGAWHFGDDSREVREDTPADDDWELETLHRKNEDRYQARQRDRQAAEDQCQAKENQPKKRKSSDMDGVDPDQRVRGRPAMKEVVNGAT